MYPIPRCWVSEGHLSLGASVLPHNSAWLLNSLLSSFAANKLGVSVLRSLRP